MCDYVKYNASSNDKYLIYRLNDLNSISILQHIKKTQMNLRVIWRFTTLINLHNYLSVAD